MQKKSLPPVTRIIAMSSRRMAYVRVVEGSIRQIRQKDSRERQTDLTLPSYVGMGSVLRLQDCSEEERTNSHY